MGRRAPDRRDDRARLRARARAGPGAAARIRDPGTGGRDRRAGRRRREQPVNPIASPDIDWAHLSPVVIVLGAAAIGVLLEAFVPARVRRTVQLSFTSAALAGALVAVAALWSGVKSSGGVRVLGSSLIVDGPTLVLW